MVKNADYWAINRPDIEVRPWAGSAAELLNKIPVEQAQKLTEINAAVAVTVGMSMLILKRAQIDRMMKLEHMRERREELQKQEGVPPQRQELRVNPDEPARSGTTRRNGTQSGAQSVHPEQPIFGQSEGLR